MYYKCIYWMMCERWGRVCDGCDGRWVNVERKDET